MIEISGLCKRFRNKNVLMALDLTVREGESVVVIGGSGTGKSVLLKHIIGLLRPDKGQIVVGGKDITTLSEKDLYAIRKKFGMLFQGAALFDSLNVWENVSFVLLRENRKNRKEAREVAERKLHMVGLVGVEELMPSELSGGMKKRVGLARAIAHDPEILLYDEPTTGLDPIMADAINELIIRMRKNLAVTSVTITHDMNSAYKIADRIAMLYQGRIEETGTPEEIRNTSNPIVRQFISGSAVGPITVEGINERSVR